MVAERCRGATIITHHGYQHLMLFWIMRTTLEIDDVVLTAVKSLAKEQGLTIGQVMSRLAQQALGHNQPGQIRNGVPLFASQPGVRRPDLALVNSLRDDG